ncbi:MAG TPA: DJ-1/PfpI family protein [Opitutaceae bacterium]|nr:DJ-1/PfpI family protein [Opitutaceae bacterium]
MKRNVAILLFDEVEVLDFAGPFEVFAVTDELRGHNTFNVFTLGESTTSIRARNGLKVVADYALKNLPVGTGCPAPHLLVVPGGFGTRALLRKPALLEWIRTTAQAAELTISVCTGALVLGKAGLLEGLRATTHHDCFDALRENAPHTEVVEDQRFVDNGSILTAAGISAGIDCALHVVGRLLGTDAATATAQYMEFRRA